MSSVRTVCLSVFVGGVATVVGAAQVFAAPLVVDDFNDGDFNNFLTTEGGVYLQQAGSMLGAERDVLFAVLDDPDPSPRSVGVGISVSGGTLNFFSDSGYAGAVGLDYDGAGDMQGPLFPLLPGPGIAPVIDSTQYDRVRVEFGFSSASFVMGALLANSPTQKMPVFIFEALQMGTTVPASQDPFYVDLLFADGSASAGFDPAEVERIAFTFNFMGGIGGPFAEPDLDFSIQRILLLPTPGAVGLCAIGSLVMFGRLRSRPTS